VVETRSSQNFKFTKDIKMNRLNGKTALITGSARGLGKAMALQFAHEGADIVINDVDPKVAEATASEIQELGRKVLVSTHDISDSSEVEKLFSEIKTSFGSLDILVNNAGVLRDNMLTKMSDEEFDTVIAVNLKGVFNCSRDFAKLSKETEKGGVILNLSSVAYLGNVGQSNYSASKAGVVGMTRTWALELSKLGIRVNAIAPGFMKTRMTAGIPEEIVEVFKKKIPLRRMGTPEDLANLATFLVSEESAYLTGQVIHLDGGLSVGI
jgi:3-oxoacyl-[acyl-carrier protein] reductase